MSLLCDVFDLVLTFFDIFFRLLLHEQFGPITFLLLHKTKAGMTRISHACPCFITYISISCQPSGLNG